MKRKRHRFIFAAILIAFTAISLSTGFVYLIDNNLLMLVLSFILRILQGAATFASNLLPVDFIHVHFPDQFDFMNSVALMGCFCGHGISESIGCLLYDRFGYVVPFIFAASLTFFAAILLLLTFPDTETYLSSQDTDRSDNAVLNSSEKANPPLTKALIFPLMVTMLINANHGVLQVSVTPFLHENFGVSISYAGRCLMFLAVGMASGGLLTGVLLQSKKLSHYTVMAIGTGCLFVGLNLTFPPTFIPSLYKVAPTTAFPGVFLAGLGDPLVTITTLTALYDLQELRMGPLTPEVVTKITSIWLMGYCAFYFGGPFIAGFLTDYLSFSDSSLILSSLCVLSLMICVVMRTMTARMRKRKNSEKRPLLQDNLTDGY